MKPEFICKLQRYRKLSQLQKYYESKQYDGRPDFFTGQGPDGIVPLRERKPCVIYPLPKAAVGQVVRFCFGEGKFPALQVERHEDGDIDDRGMSEADADALEECLEALIKHAKIRSVITAMMKRGLAEKTAVAIFSIKRGRISVELPHAKDCWPTFRENDPSGELESLTWCYQYEEDVQTKDGIVCKRFWFRRDVTTTAYLEYPKVEVEPGVTNVKWPAPKEIPHAFKCCPVRWSKNLDDESEAGGIDGTSLFEDFLDEIDALNFALSQRHRGITFMGTPQPYETGVEEDDGPSNTGTTSKGYSPSGGKSPHGAVSRQDARKMAPDQVWRYEGQNVTLGLLETTGKAFETTTLHVEDIRSRVLESMSVVLANADQFLKNGGDMNAKFLTLAYAPLLALVSELRDVTWWGELLAVLSICTRMVAADNSNGVIMPGAKKLAQLASKFEVETDEGPVWMFPDIKPIWGQFFEPSQDEIESAVRTANQAKDGGVVQAKTATRHVANHFGITNVDDEVTQTQAESAQRQADAMKQAQASAKQVPPAPTKKKAKAA